MTDKQNKRKDDKIEIVIERLKLRGIIENVAIY